MIFIIIGVMLIILECILPGGICGIIAAICLSIAIILSFAESFHLGMSVLIGALLFISFAISIWIRYFPQSKIGQCLTLNSNAKTWRGYDSTYQNLIGKLGVAHTDCRPSGLVRIENVRIDVVSQGEMIYKGDSIQIIKVEGNRIVIRKNERSEIV